MKRSVRLVGTGLFSATLACEGDKRPDYGDSPTDSATPEELYDECVAALQDVPRFGGPDRCAGTTITDPMGGIMIGIPAGTFTMGSAWGWDEAIAAACVLAYPDDYAEHPYSPEHEVTLTRDFWIGQTEVTVAQYVAVMGDRGLSSSFACDECPVSANFNSAAAYANALSEAEGLTPCYCLLSEFSNEIDVLAPPHNCTGYRLPTEAEWEYAARAGSIADYPNGGNFVDSDPDSWVCGEVTLDNGQSVGSFGWYCGNYEVQEDLQPVGSLDPNEWGVYDTSGGARELTSDLPAYLSRKSATDPFVGPPPTSLGPRPESPLYWAILDYPYVVARGGDIGSQALCLASGLRQYVNPWGGQLNGFRLVRTCP